LPEPDLESVTVVAGSCNRGNAKRRAEAAPHTRRLSPLFGVASAFHLLFSTIYSTSYSVPPSYRMNGVVRVSLLLKEASKPPTLFPPTPPFHTRTSVFFVFLHAACFTTPLSIPF